ncbi:MAG TPA: hypothetical protein ENK75_03855 [Saprospiraceae bacterium]|nr:hypothetical protein [Saprospiraceae bacterium]
MKSNKHKLNPKDIQNALNGKLEQARINDLDEFAQEALKGIQYLDNKQTLDAISKNAYKRFRKTKQKRQPYTLLAKVAAIVIGIIAFSQWILPKQNNTHIAKLAKEIPCAHPLCDTRDIDLTRQTPKDIQLEEAFAAFQNKNYPKAATLFSLYLNKNNHDASIAFYNGISLMKSNQTDKAIHTFESLITPTQRVFNAQLNYTRWYLSLCYLDTQQENKALPLLIALEKSDSKFNNKARQLLLELD